MCHVDINSWANPVLFNRRAVSDRQVFRAKLPNAIGVGCGDASLVLIDQILRLFEGESV